MIPDSIRKYVYYDEKGVTIYHGECVEVMQGLPSDSVDSIVTDPPYGIRFMGKSWDGKDIEKQTATRRSYKTDAPGVGPQGGHNSKAVAAGKYDLRLTANQAFAEWMRVWCVEALRILKPGGHMLVFCGPRTYHRMASGVEDAGFEIRDQIMWLYGSGFPKSLDISKAIDKAAGVEREVVGIKTRPDGTKRPNAADWDTNKSDFGRYKQSQQGYRPDGPKYKNEGTSAIIEDTAPATPEAQQWDGWGTALKPAHEPIVVARKPLIGTVAENVLKHGTGGINIDGGRVEIDLEIDASQLRTINRNKRNNDGWGMTTKSSDKPSVIQPKGRFPANIILDPEAGAMLDKQSGDSVSSGGQKSLGAFRNGDVYGKGLDIREAGNPGLGDSGGASRFFYCAKASKQDRDEGLEGMQQKEAGIKNDSGRGYSETDPYAKIMRRNHHPTVKPTSLMQYLCRLVTPPGGTILDPFMGSGSTGKAAVREGFKFIGIEREAEYIPIAIARINAPAQVELI